jgi:hypothetical protein
MMMTTEFHDPRDDPARLRLLHLPNRFLKYPPSEMKLYLNSRKRRRPTLQRLALGPRGVPILTRSFKPGVDDSTYGMQLCAGSKDPFVDSFYTRLKKAVGCALQESHWDCRFQQP